ncbi:MAG: LPS assembly lipoprotein LptE [Shimia sp.]
MSSSSALPRRAVLLGGLALAGCGFTPAYGPGPAQALRGRVAVDAPDNRDGFDLVRALEARLGLPEAPAFGLSIAVDTQEEGIGVDRDGRTTRFQILAIATYALRDLQTLEVVDTGSVETFTAYSTTDTTIAERAAEDDARARLMVILADLITTRLIAATA